jgi:hypothetical protein
MLEHIEGHNGQLYGQRRNHTMVLVPGSFGCILPLLVMGGCLCMHHVAIFPTA